MKIHWYSESLHGIAENLEDTCEKCLHFRLNLPTDSFHVSQLTCFPSFTTFQFERSTLNARFSNISRLLLAAIARVRLADRHDGP